MYTGRSIVELLTASATVIGKGCLDGLGSKITLVGVWFLLTMFGFPLFILVESRVLVKVCWLTPFVVSLVSAFSNYDDLIRCAGWIPQPTVDCCSYIKA